MVDAKNLAELSDLAKQLNSQTDSLNDAISALNRRLTAMNIGIECYLDRPLISSGMSKDGDTKYEEDTYLGYDKVGHEGAWELAIKEERIEYQWDRDSGEEIPVTETWYTPLLRESRDVRLKAVEQFDELIGALTRQAKKKLAGIETAKKLANI